MQSGAGAQPAVVAEGPFRVGDVVGGVYEIVAHLGAGGMSVVYEAHDRVLGRNVAIKAARGEAVEAALRNEARALAALRHPGLVTVHAGGRHADAEYIVMELVRGETLERRIDDANTRGEPIAVDEALDVLVAIADGLCAMHAAGIAHRDLKPANVILSGSRVVLIDLGLFIPEFAVSDDNEVAGSPEYVAPEVLLRTVQPGGGPLIDLYALGVIAFELLAGSSPFTAPDTSKILSRHLTSPPPDVRAVRGDVPPKLSSLIGELMAKDPDARPQSSEAALWRLCELRGTPATAVRDLRVMVVDDDPEIGSLLQQTLEASFPGLGVETTTDPRTAIASIEREPPDVVAVDLNMPWMNGIEMCMRIDALPAERRPAILAMSGAATKRDVDVLRALGAVRFVPKDLRFVAAVGDVVGTLRRAHEPPPSSRPTSSRRR